MHGIEADYDAKAEEWVIDEKKTAAAKRSQTEREAGQRYSD